MNDRRLLTKPVLHAQPWPHYLSKPRGVASCRELAATCSEAATAGSFFLLFQTEEVWRFVLFFYCCLESVWSGPFCAAYNLADFRVVTTLVTIRNLSGALRTCSVQRTMCPDLSCSQMWYLGGTHSPQARKYFTSKE